MKLFTRYRILNSARAMVAEVGVERVTMRGIAAMANITAAAIYRHFRNKREMLEQVVAHGYQDLSYRMLKRAQKAPGRPRSLRVMIDEAAVFAERHPNLFQMMAAPRSDDHEAVERIEHEVEECMAAKVLPRDNSEKVTVAIWSLVRGFLGRRPEGQDRARYRAVVDCLKFAS
ncbi:MAG TPA: TetR family transcriptional regulator [Myxococcales bacterium]|jgi:AcrR family transcriptional regulator|nr:TetR family transcriptional regulator [Myxococcales bacterium]